MDKKDLKLHDLVSLGDLQNLLDEIMNIVSLMAQDFDYDTLEKIHKDIISLFEGEFPGYRASNTKYHNLEHTNYVALTMARLLHGLFLEGHRFTPREILLGLTAAFFHDTGLIQDASDIDGTGAKYTIGHEARSIAFMSRYLAAMEFTAEEIEDCSSMIQCTILDKPVTEVAFRTPQVEMIGKAVGSSDLLAQMADRYYLEKLPLLFKEFEEGGVQGYASELELIRKTENFYQTVARKRLRGQMGNVGSALRAHFRDYWEIDKDLYDEAIKANIRHLGEIQQKCEDLYECKLADHLRRGGILQKYLNEEESA